MMTQQTRDSIKSFSSGGSQRSDSFQETQQIFSVVDSQPQSAMKLKRYQRQEVYEFMSTQTLYLKIAKLSKKEREFVKQSSQQRTLTVIPPKCEVLEHSDIDFWLYIQTFASTLRIVVPKNSEERQFERAQLFIRMLPICFLKNRKLEIVWEGTSRDFNEFVPYLKRQNQFFLPRKVEMRDSTLTLDKNIRILTFLMGSEEVSLTNVKVSLAMVGNETNYQRSLKVLRYRSVEETVNFIQGLGEAETLILRESVLKLAANRAFLPKDHVARLKLDRVSYRYMMHEEPKHMNLSIIKELIGQNSIIEELSLHLHTESQDSYQEFLKSSLPKLKRLKIKFSEVKSLPELIELGLTRKLENGFIISCRNIRMIDHAQLQQYNSLSGQSAFSLSEQRIMSQIALKYGIKLEESWPLRFVRRLRCTRIGVDTITFDIINDLSKPGSNWSLF